MDQPCPETVDVITRIERLERTVALLVGAALDAAERELTDEQLRQVRAAVLRTGVETANRLRASSS